MSNTNDLGLKFLWQGLNAWESPRSYLPRVSLVLEKIMKWFMKCGLDWILFVLPPVTPRRPSWETQSPHSTGMTSSSRNTHNARVINPDLCQNTMLSYSPVSDFIWRYLEDVVLDVADRDVFARLSAVWPVHRQERSESDPRTQH